MAEILREDGWQNVFTGLGIEGRDQTQATRFVSRPLDRAEVEQLYEGEPLFARMVDAVPENATRPWIGLTAPGMDDDFGPRVLEALEDLDAQGQCFELMRMSRLEGGAVMLIGADDGLDPKAPLDMSRIRSLKHLNVVSRYAITPGTVSSEADATQVNWLEPESYVLTGSGVQVHRSRVIRLRGILTTPRRDASRQGWGLPIADRCAPVCRQLGSAFGYFEAALKDFIMGVVTIPGLRDLIMTDAGNDLLRRRIRMIQMTGSVLNCMVIDGDEKYERRGSALAGMSDGLIRLMDLAAAVSEIPLSILFGQPPTGLSTDDASARKTFNASISNKRRRELRPTLRRIINTLLASQEGPTKGKVPEHWKLQFLPLEEPSAKEDAETANLRAQSEDTRITGGVLSVREARSGIRSDPRSIYALDPGYDDALDATEAAVGAGVDATGAELDAPPPDAAPPPPDAATPEVPAADVPAANTALNGAQVAAALDIVDRVARGELPRGTGLAMLVEFFNLEGARAERIMGDVGRSFTLAEPAPAAPLQVTPPPPPSAPTIEAP